MVMTDFYYAGKMLSDLGCIIAYGNTSPSESMSMGSELSFETVVNQITWETDNLKAKYENPISVTFDIIKYSCKSNNDTFSDIECSHIMRWLNRKKATEFTPIYDDNSFNSIYFIGTFTKIDQINIGGKCIGFTVTFNATSSWGFERVIDATYNLSAGESFNIFNGSDEIGFLYPESFVIKILKDGDFTMSNSMDNRAVIIKNCIQGETITFNCKRQLMESDKYQIGINEQHSTLMNDFNYNFPRLVSREDEEINVFTVNLDCEIHMDYTMVRKVGILV